MKRVHAHIVVNVTPRQTTDDVVDWVQRTYDFYHPRWQAALSHDDSAALLEQHVSVRRVKLLLEINVDDTMSPGETRDSVQRFYDYQHPALEAVATVDGSFVDGFSLLGESEEPVNGLALLGEDISPALLALLGDGEPPGFELLN